MPRILNLNDFSAKFLKMIFALVVFLPVLLYVIFLELRSFQIIWPVLLDLARGSLILGLALLGLLVVLIILEQIQDRWIVLQYDRSRAKRLPVGDGWYECQYCGNRRVRPDETTCGVCGKALQ